MPPHREEIGITFLSEISQFEIVPHIAVRDNMDRSHEKSHVPII